MIFYLFFSAAYVFLSIYTSLKISKSITLSRQQKTINIVLNALIPLLWYYLASPIIFPKDKIITRDEREKLIAEESGSKLESTSQTGAL